MTWDIDEFVKVTEAIFALETHTMFVESTLPNSGDTLDDICNKGLEQLERNGEKLCRGITGGLES